MGWITDGVLVVLSLGALIGLVSNLVWRRTWGGFTLLGSIELLCFCAAIVVTRVLTDELWATVSFIALFGTGFLLKRLDRRHRTARSTSDNRQPPAKVRA